jgi:hypothetical protein
MRIPFVEVSMSEPPPRSPVPPAAGSNRGVESPPSPGTAPAWETTPENAPPVSPVSGWGARIGGFVAAPIAGQLRNFALAGAALGALIGAARAASLHVPGGGIALAALRMACAGAAAGASLPALVRALAALARAAGWIVLAALLGWLALLIAGNLEWIRALAPAVG